jgi:hypothetical protein
LRDGPCGVLVLSAGHDHVASLGGRRGRVELVSHEVLDQRANLLRRRYGALRGGAIVVLRRNA